VVCEMKREMNVSETNKPNDVDSYSHLSESYQTVHTTRESREMGYKCLNTCAGGLSCVSCVHTKFQFHICLLTRLWKGTVFWMTT
jgi:hypothetical protein